MFMSFARFLAFCVALVLLAGPRAVCAAWSTSPYQNTPFSTAAGDQYEAVSVTDGAGGAFVVWRDDRAGTNSDLYAQRRLADGTSAWPGQGIAIAAEAGVQSQPAICSDGSGGFIVAWRDTRGGSADIYVQRVNGAGNRSWTSSGVLLCAATGDQRNPSIVPDGTGGAIVGWIDDRAGVNAADVYARRVNSAGTPLWTANGVAVCTASGTQSTLSLVPGGPGTGASYVVWVDGRTNPTAIYAQYLVATGAAQWTANGKVVKASAFAQSSAVAASDGAGGALIAFEANYASGDRNLRVARLDAGGTDSYSAAGTVTGNGGDLAAVAPDGVGGAIVAFRWTSGPLGGGVYAQRLRADGTSHWSHGPLQLAITGGLIARPTVLTNGAAHSIIAWTQPTGALGSSDVYAQALTANGAKLWAEWGTPVTLAPRSQYEVSLVPDDDAGAIVVWTDERVGSHRDVYGQRVERFGKLGDPAPVIVSARDVPHDQGGKIKLSWDASYLDTFPEYEIGEYRVWRSVPPNSAAMAKTDGLWPTLREAAAAEVLTAAYAIEPRATSTIYWELVGTQPAEGEAGYSWTVTTTADSTAAANARTLLRVTARAATGPGFWQSAPDSAYSVDNLAPAAVQQFQGTHTAGTTRLRWLPNLEADLAGYRLHAGEDPTFVPDVANLVSAPADTGYVGLAAADLTWKIAAVDVHGNVGTYVAVSTGSATASGDVPSVTVLVVAPAAPNPFNPLTTLRFLLPSTAPTTVRVHDLQGRHVRTLLDRSLEAGEHRVQWDGRDATAARVASGTYVVRVTSGKSEQTVRVTLVK